MNRHAPHGVLRLLARAPANATARFGLGLVSLPRKPPCIAHTLLTRQSRSSRTFTTSSPTTMAAHKSTIQFEGLTKLQDVEELSPGITRIMGQNPSMMTLQGTCTYLLQPPNTPSAPLVLIDTTSRETADKWVDLVMGRLAAIDRDAKAAQPDAPAPYIQSIFLTHRHGDHVGGLVPLLAALKSKGMPPPRVYKVPNPDEAAVVASRPEWSDGALVASLAGAHLTAQSGSIAPIGEMKDGMVFDNVLPGQSFTVLQTPGHTADSTSFAIRAQGDADWSVFTGDTVLGEGTTIFTDLGAYLTSLRRLVSLAPRALYPAHGRNFTNKEDSLDHLGQYLSHRQDREDEIVKIFKALAASPGSLGSMLETVRAKTQQAAKAAAGKPPADPKVAAAFELALDSQPLTPGFAASDGAYPTAITIPLLCHLIYKTGSPGIVRAASIPTTAHVRKLEEDGVVARKEAVMPVLDGWAVAKDERQEVYQWCGA